MIIEDEAIIAMDLTAIIETMGHDVTGVARTHREAVKLALEETPDLILADIQLADNSSGIEAVNEILGHFAHIPVIFVTAFPERLLTGERPEPAFLINKPYTEEQVRSAVSQAMFFASTETHDPNLSPKKPARHWGGLRRAPLLQKPLPGQLVQRRQQSRIQPDRV
jgi:CheY-like chemotaxis protein